jgi:lysine N6-hydroxylase
MKTENIIAVGAGPSGLSLSALASTCSEVSVSLLERAAHFEWHCGMMLNNARMQSNALKDLVTPVDPTNPFGFLSFLKFHGRLYSALVNGLDNVSRKEFEAYLVAR